MVDPSVLRPKSMTHANPEGGTVDDARRRKLLRCILVPWVLLALSGCQKDEQGREFGAASSKEAGAREFSPTEEQGAALRALGYVAGTETLPEQVGVTLYDRKRAHAGVNLVVSGSAQQATLIDMHGSTLHTWRYDGSAHFDIQPDRDFWVNAHLMDNGDLLAIIDPHGVVKIDKDSSLIWATDASRMMHHDFSVTDDGLIYVLGRRFEKRPEIDPKNTIIQDLVVVLDADGNRVREFSILNAFLKSPFGDEVARQIRREERVR